MQALTNEQGSGAWGTHTLATAACGKMAEARNLWTLESAEGGYKLKNANGYLNISRNIAALNETGHIFELVYHGDAGWAIKSQDTNEYGNNLGGSGSIGGWSDDGTKFDLYKVVEMSVEEVDPYGKLRGLWKKVHVDTETIYDAKEGKFEYAWDSNPGTHWHSNWQGASDKLNGSNTFTGIIDFGQAYVIDQFSFTPRQDGNNSGLITQASLYVRETEDAEWKAVAEHATFDANTGKKDINFDDQAVRYVKFVAEQSNDGWVTVSEFEIARISVDEHTHSYTGEVTTAATCTEAGVMTYTCECSDSYTEVIPATGHRNTVTTPAVLPTLNAPGKTEEVYCNDCQQIVSASEEVAQLTVKNAQPLMDNWNSGVVALSDCEYTLTGTEGSYSLCHGGHYYVKPAANGNGIPQQNEPFTGVILAFQNNGKVRIGGNGYIHVHRAGASDTREGNPYWDKCGNSHGDADNGTDELYFLKKNADSTNANIPGYEQVTSVEAGESYLIAFANARGEWFVMYPSTETVSIAKVVDDAVTHTHEYTTTTQAATCTTDGLKTDTCQCGHVHTEVIPATGEHEWVDATCTAPKTCSACGATEGEALGHTASEAVIENKVDSTCTEDGSYDSVICCTVCGEETSRETKVVTALGHTEEVIPGKDATCTETGLTEGKKCTVCGETLAIQEETPALGHDWHGRDCSRCDEQYANPFVDVPEDEFYVDPVLWALQEGITAGTTANTFSPYKNVTRAEAVTFLWRAVGAPEPATEDNPFADVTEADYFYKAVLWAYEKGITVGVGENTFAPHVECNRAQIVTFLWRAMGAPESQTEVNFADVAPDAYYIDAVAWAVENGITAGMGGGYFGTGNTCTRAQVVTFLYRTLA